MRLTNVTHMALPQGRLLGFRVDASVDETSSVPISFDQGRHVAQGQRPGSWMAMSARLPAPVSRESLGRAWDAAIRRHGSLATTFSTGDDGTVTLHETRLGRGAWHEQPVTRTTREALRDLLDVVCAPFERPSYRLCLVEPDAREADRRPAVIIASDHAHVDMWSLLVLVRDLTVCLDDLTHGRIPGADLPDAPEFAEHTRALLARPTAPADVVDRWAGVLAAEDGWMPRFPLPLGDAEPVPHGVYETRDVLDAAETEQFAAHAHARGVRMISLATSALTEVTARVAGRPFRVVFPVHSRYEPRWHDAVGWFITNAVLESTDPDPQACAAAVKEAIGLGSWPLAPIFAPYGGMPEGPGMFAMSWLDVRRLPVAVDPALEVQFVSAAIRTDGVMIWFVVNDAGMHLRCRYPDTPEAHRNVGRWLDLVEQRLRELAG